MSDPVVRRITFGPYVVGDKRTEDIIGEMQRIARKRGSLDPLPRSVRDKEEPE